MYNSCIHSYIHTFVFIYVYIYLYTYILYVEYNRTNHVYKYYI